MDRAALGINYDYGVELQKNQKEFEGLNGEAGGRILASWEWSAGGPPASS